MKFLVDANVLSEPTKERPDKSVVEWLEQNETELAVNPIILGELEYGILVLPTGRRRMRLLTWFAQGVAHLRVLELDREAAGVWARILADLKRKGRAMPLKDSLLAATAAQHRLTVVTRNVGDYRYTGIEVVNPFKN